jgi:hypothetical protein
LDQPAVEFGERWFVHWQNKIYHGDTEARRKPKSYRGLTRKIW